jgi:hypothetical protein
MVELLMAYQLWGNFQLALNNPPGLTTQFDAETHIDHRFDKELINFLQNHHENFGYTNYWVAYPLAFVSNEQLIFTPRLPYHLDFRYTRRDDRYAPYDRQVGQADRIAYITSKHEPLDEHLRSRFSELGISWQEAWVGDYHIFYALTRPVRPSEISLGETTQP